MRAWPEVCHGHLPLYRAPAFARGALRGKHLAALAPARSASRGIAGCGRLEGHGPRIRETASSKSGWNDRLRVAATWITLRFGETETQSHMRKGAGHDEITIYRS